MNDSDAHSIPKNFRRSREVKKVVKDLDVGAGDNSYLILVQTKGQPELTVIDGVHRAIRYCSYYLVRKERTWKPKRVYLGIIRSHENHNIGVKKSIASSDGSSRELNKSRHRRQSCLILF